MLPKIKLAILAASLISSIGLAAPAMAATHTRHAPARISRNIRAQAIERRPVDLQGFPAGGLENYPHRFCCS